MKTKLVLISIIAILAAISSCKKKSSATPQSEIVGSWRLTSTAIDLNGNGIMDSSEITTNDTSFAHYLVTFNANGSAVSTYYNEASHFNWAFEFNNTYLKMTNTDSTTGAVDYSLIVSMSSSRISYKDTTGGYATWFTITKQ